MPGYGVATYYVMGAFVGTHLSDPYNSPFSAYRVRFANLTQFAGAQRFDVRREGDVVQVSAALADSLFARLPGMEVRVEFELSTSGDGLTDLALRHDPSVAFRFDDAITVRDFERGPMRSMHTLIELASDAYVPVLNISAISEEKEPQPPDGAPILSDTDEVEILFKPRAPQKSTHLNAYQLAFTLASLGPNWGGYFERWHLANSKYKPTLDHLFSLRRTDSMPVEHRFLSLVQAVESFHRRAFPERTRESPSDFKERKRRIVGSLSKDDRQWVLNAVQFGNEPRLADRLRDLWELLPPTARLHLGSQDDFARSTAYARNHLTHHTTTHRAVKVEPRELFKVALRLLFVLRVLLLRELGVNPEQILSTPWGLQIISTFQR
jgi:hypothetical protein